MGMAPGRLLAFVLCAALAGCGSEVSEVRLDLQEDGSSPCMGAAHMMIRVISSDGPSREFHEFGQFFRGDNAACVNGEFRFAGLDFSRSVQIAVQLYDSTTDQSGMLATGTSLPLAIQQGAPTTQLMVSLSRTDARLGTLRIGRAPADFFQYANVDHLLYSVTPDGDTSPTRSGYLAFAPERILDPFPLIVSNLPIPATTSVMRLRMDAQDAAGQPVHTWTGTGMLGGEAFNPAEVSWDP